MTKQSVRQDVLDFLTGVHGERDDISARKDKMIQRAYSLAYRDMATHTVVYRDNVASLYFKGEKDKKFFSDNRDLVREAVKKYVLTIFDDFDNETPETFDMWHRRSCEYIVAIKDDESSDFAIEGIKDGEGTPVNKVFYIKDVLAHDDPGLRKDGYVFSIGQAQKIINMMLKYLYIYYQCDGWTTLDELSLSFHNPVDSFVLGAALGTDDYKGTPWSQIKIYDDYIECQKAIKGEIGNKATTPFFWELFGWPFEQEIKDRKKLRKAQKKAQKATERTAKKAAKK